jgi:hypothetical protein
MGGSKRRRGKISGEKRKRTGDTIEEWPHGVTSKKSPCLIVTAVKASNLTQETQFFTLLAPKQD